jgi:phosphoribosylaminoimidazole (AIR) synthetase
MGIGYVIIVRAADADKAVAALKAAKQKAIIVGRIEKGTGQSVLIN